MKQERLSRVAGQFSLLWRFFRYQPGSIWNLGRTLAYHGLPFNIRSSHIGFSPVTYTLYINNYCNYQCPFCFLTKRDIPRETMSTEDFHRIISHTFNRHAYRVTLGGGEPFLHPMLFYFAAALKVQKKYVSVYTNGSLLKKYLSQLQEGHIDCLNVSHYDESFADIKDVLRNMCQEIGFPIVRLSRIVRRNELVRMGETIEIALENRIPMLIFKNYMPFDGANVEYVLTRGDLELENELDRLKHKYRDVSLKITWPNLLDPLGSFNCRNPGLNIIYGPSGTIAPCCFIVPPSVAFGSLFNSSDSWNSEPIKSLRLGHNEKCKLCYFRHGLQNRL